MTHHHLRFKVLNRIKCNADHNEYRGTAEGDVDGADVSDDDRKDGDNAEEESSQQGDTGEYLGKEVGSGLSGTDTGNRTAVFTDVVSDLHRIVLNLSIEVSEGDDHYEVEYRVKEAPRAEESEYLLEGRKLLGAGGVNREGKDHRGKHKDGACEDDRHNARHIYLEGDV